jgi:hypothetical protein
MIPMPQLKKAGRKKERVDKEKLEVKKNRETRKNR